MLPNSRCSYTSHSPQEKLQDTGDWSDGKGRVTYSGLASSFVEKFLVRGIYCEILYEPAEAYLRTILASRLQKLCAQTICIGSIGIGCCCCMTKKLSCAGMQQNQWRVCLIRTKPLPSACVSMLVTRQLKVRMRKVAFRMPHTIAIGQTTRAVQQAQHAKAPTSPASAIATESKRALKGPT